MEVCQRVPPENGNLDITPGIVGPHLWPVIDLVHCPPYPQPGGWAAHVTRLNTGKSLGNFGATPRKLAGFFCRHFLDVLNCATFQGGDIREALG